ncbi:ABC transporter permease [Maritalea sp.]|uniref:ABC transporter permease n=1 Tax=Maritalea sp. TaxID=2003361 RepID=UPI003EF0BB42
MNLRKRNWGADPLDFAPVLMIVALIGPLIAGLVGVFLPAFGYFPSLGGEQFTFTYFHEVTHKPGFWASVLMSIWIGLATTFLSLVIVVSFFASQWGSRLFAKLTHFISPLMSVPHAAAAFGFAFLIAPSGWIIRLLSPWATGFTHHPPDWLIVNDPMGNALLLGLVLKEIPFLFLVGLSASSQINVDQRLKVGRSFGYGQVWAWFSTVFPAFYKQMRLPIYAVVAFSSSVVDVALILGPNFPAMLPVQLLRWMNDPELETRFIAAAGAVWQLAATVTALVLWRIGEALVTYVGRRAIINGDRHKSDGWFKAISSGAMALTVLISMLGLVILAIWSVAGFWRFPNALPSAFTISRWVGNLPAILTPATNAMAIGVTSTLISIILTIACLENEYRRDVVFTPTAMRILYLPLIVPQIAFLFGISVLLVRFGLDGSFWPVALAHTVFVLPYVFLSLAAPYRNFDLRYLRVAASLGSSENKALISVRLPMLLKPILLATALGIAISIAQYLPTLLIGAGRVPTITTEAVALASGGDRRIIGIYALVQTLLPAIGFVAAVLVPRLAFPNRAFFK